MDSHDGGYYSYLGARPMGLPHPWDCVFVVDAAFAFRGRHNRDLNLTALIHLALAVSEQLPRWREVQYDSCERPICVGRVVQHELV